MRKFSMVLAAAVVTGLAANAMAGESNYWFDVRNNSAGIQSITAPVAPFTVGQGEALFANDTGPAGGGKGAGQVLRLCPSISNGFESANPTSYPAFDDTNASTGDLWLYCDVNPSNDVPASAGDVISSIGIDIAVSDTAATPRYEIASLAYSWQITDPSVPVNYGFAQGTSTRAGVTGAKYVKVPVNGSSLYATAGGLVPSATSYQIGKLRVTAAGRGAVGCQTGSAHAANSTYSVNLSVNNLLITRTFSTGGNAVPEERVSFGYTGGALEADVSGNTVGGAGARDAAIQVRLKGDTNGSGNVNGLDIGGFTAAVVPLTQTQRYLYDRNNSGNVNGLDIGQFTAAQTAPCP